MEVFLVGTHCISCSSCDWGMLLLGVNKCPQDAICMQSMFCCVMRLTLAFG